MKVVALGDVVDFRSGVGFPPRLQGRSSGTYPMAKVGDISQVGRSESNTLSTTNHYVSEADLSVLKMRPVPVGSVLFAKIGEAIRQNHRVLAGRALLLDNNAMAAIPRADSIDGRYLFRFLQTVDFYRLAASTTVPSLRKSELAKLDVALPPLPEQRRIAAILDHADVLRAKRRQVLAHLDSLTQSIFHDMFGKHVPRAPLGELAETRLGKMLDAKKQTGEHRRPYLRNANVQWFRLDLDDLLEMDFDERDRATFTLKDGDVLVCEGGQPGRSAIWRGELAECYFQKAVHRVRLGDDLEPDYFVRAMKAIVDSNGLKDFVTSSTIAHLTGEKFRTLPIPVPPLYLQREFAVRASRIKSHQEAIQCSLAADDELFASVQSRAFRGDL